MSPSPLRSALLAVAATLFVASASPARAQDPDPAAYRFGEAELDQIVAPVALYPDVVLDALLPATTEPDALFAAAHRAAISGNTPAISAEAAWPPAVQALAQYPDVLRWLGDNRDWTSQVGWAMTVQPDDVLAAVQRARARAYEAGVLVTNSYQRVVVLEGPVYLIEPAAPDVVYVPVYDPVVLFQPTILVERPFYLRWWGFSFGTFGPWAWHEIRWQPHHRGLYVHDRPWWWNRWRRSSRDWGPDRPRRWTANREASTVLRPRSSRTVLRPRAPREDEGARLESGATVTTRPRASAVQAPPPRPDVRQALRARLRRERATTEGAGLPTATTRRLPAGTLRPPAVRTPARPLPSVEVPTTDDAPNVTRPRADRPATPSLRTPSVRVRSSIRERARPTVLDRRTTEAWSRRGHESLGGARQAAQRARAATPKNVSSGLERPERRRGAADEPKAEAETPPVRREPTEEELRRRRDR
jgi:hypothetical protein